MRSKYTPELVRARREAVTAGRFRYPTRRTRKIACVTCGDNGYEDGWWMDKHLGDHAPCPECGKVRPVATMGLHRAHHRRQR